MRDDRLRFNTALLNLEGRGAICLPLRLVEFRRHSNQPKNLTPQGCPADLLGWVVSLLRILRLRERRQHPPDKRQSA